MQQIKKELTKAGIPYANECLGGNIQGVRIGNMYIVEHGLGTGYYVGDLEDAGEACYTLEEALELAKKYKEIDVVIIEAGSNYTHPVEYFKMKMPESEEQAIAEAIKAVEARGYTVISNDAGGCNEVNRVSYGEDYITVTVEPE